MYSKNVNVAARLQRYKKLSNFNKSHNLISYGIEDFVTFSTLPEGCKGTINCLNLNNSDKLLKL